MALRLNRTYSFGLDVDTYARIVHNVIDKHRGYNVQVEFYAYAAEGEQAQHAGIERLVYHFPFEADPTPQVPNVLARAYELLKTLPEFADAVDV